MKRLFLILLIIFSLPAMAQYDVFGQYNNPFSVWGSKTKTPAGGNYVQRAWDFFNRVTALGKTLTAAQQRWYNDSIFVPLLDSGLIGQTRSGDSLQALWVLATFPNGNANVCYLNLLSDSNTIQNVNSVTFTDSGCVGGNTKYLNTNFNLTWDSSIVKALSASMGIYSITDVTEGAYDFSSADNSCNDIFLVILKFNSKQYGIANNASSTVSYTTISSSTSRTIGITSRIKDSTYLYGNGIKLIAESKPLVAPSNRMWIIGARGCSIVSSYSTKIYTFAFVGSGLSSTKARALSNILNSSLKGRKYNVY